MQFTANKLKKGRIQLIYAGCDLGIVSAKAAVIETKNSGMLQTEFLGKMNNLVDNYYRISKEDEEILENLFKKYL